MGRYILGRIAGLVGVLVAVSFITFILMKSVPGGPFDMMGMQKSAMIPDEVKQILLVKYGLDKPVLVQYFLYAKNALRLDFGYSFYYNGQTVLQIFMNQWPWSIRLGLLTIAYSIVIGIGLGIAGAIWPKSFVDYFGTATVLFNMSMPSFIFAFLLQFVFAYKLRWVPTGGVDTWQQWILPVIANSLGPVLNFQRYTRTSMADAIHSNYVRTARSKGMSEIRVMLIHVFKNALTPVVTVGGPMMAGLITGSFFIESIFRIPGIGYYWVSAIANRDYPLIMSTTIVWTAVISVTYLITDLVYGLIDPRVTYVKEK